MGTNYYFRRDDNRTRYFMGKTYGLARHLSGHGYLVVIQTASSAVARQGALSASVIEAQDLADLIDLGMFKDGYSEHHVAPTGRDNQGTSLHLLARALDVARWSERMPIAFVSEEEFEDWKDDNSWDEHASTFVSAPLDPLTKVVC